MTFKDDRGTKTDAYQKCNQSPAGPIFQLQSTPYIIVCPAFFNIANLDDLPPDNNCLRISTYINRFQDNGRLLVQYRLWILAEMIVSFYLSSTTLTLIEDASDVNRCVRLAPADSMLNARSYVYYVACELRAT